jgi:cyclophilin family peptidyl-prolyl cis-trans isomerase
MTKQYNSPPPMTIDPTKTYTASIVTDKGTMVVVLFAKETPVTVNNFVFLSREGFYTNTIFHRVIKGFMIQGGDPKGNGTGGPGYSFADEKITRDYTRGTIAMANSGPNTNGSQFFIMHATYALPKQYVIFGAIDPSDTASLATLDAIATTPVTDNGMGEDSKPAVAPVLQSIQIKEE